MTDITKRTDDSTCIDYAPPEPSTPQPYDPDALRHYVCFYDGQIVELNARSSYAAQCAAAEELKVKSSRRHMISVMLADVTHDTAAL